MQHMQRGNSLRIVALFRSATYPIVKADMIHLSVCCKRRAGTIKPALFFKKKLYPTADITQNQQVQHEGLSVAQKFYKIK